MCICCFMLHQSVPVSKHDVHMYFHVIVCQDILEHVVCQPKHRCTYGVTCLSKFCNVQWHTNSVVTWLRCHKVMYMSCALLEYSVHVLMYDVTVCTCIVMLLYMMYESTFMLSFVGQCSDVMHTCCIMLRRHVHMFDDVAKYWKVLCKVMRHQENVVRCLHIMYMCVHVL